MRAHWGDHAGGYPGRRPAGDTHFSPFPYVILYTYKYQGWARSVNVLM